MKEMNQDALSLTGLRLGIFSQILLILQEFDEASQTYDTRQEDIYNIFPIIYSRKLKKINSF